ncbi:MAG TPA: biopolymer transporter ExbD [Verrucomicrobiae bacterium]|jgi:biopolymer transport protein ExbD
MRFPRNAKLFHGQFDAAPFVAVVFIVVLFFVVQSALVFTPGVKIQLPAAEGFSGTGNPTVAVAIDVAGQLYFENQVIKEDELRERLRALVAQAKQPLTLVIQADEGVSNQATVRLCKVARELGIAEALLATRPKVFAPAPAAKAK